MNKCLMLSFLLSLCAPDLISSEGEAEDNLGIRGAWCIKAAHINGTEYTLTIDVGGFTLLIDSDAKTFVVEDEVLKEIGTNKGKVSIEGDFITLKAEKNSSIPFHILWMVKSKGKVVALYPVEKLDSIILGSEKIEDYIFRRSKADSGGDPKGPMGTHHLDSTVDQ